MGNWTDRNHGDDKNSKRKRTKLATVTQAIHNIRTTFYNREKRTTQQSRFLRPKERKRRISSRCMETKKWKKTCEFEAITATELLASNFPSLVGKSTGDYELKKKFRKSDMSVETITDILHEYMYEKLNDSPQTEEEKRIRYLNKRKTRTNKETEDKPAKFKKMDCNRCGAPNWSRQQECKMRKDRPLRKKLPAHQGNKPCTGRRNKQRGGRRMGTRYNPFDKTEDPSHTVNKHQWSRILYTYRIGQ